MEYTIIIQIAAVSCKFKGTSTPVAVRLGIFLETLKK
jgi:hypothetical protein